MGTENCKIEKGGVIKRRKMKKKKIRRGGDGEDQEEQSKAQRFMMHSFKGIVNEPKSQIS